MDVLGWQLARQSTSIPSENGQEVQILTPPSPPRPQNQKFWGRSHQPEFHEVLQGFCSKPGFTTACSREVPGLNLFVEEPK